MALTLMLADDHPVVRLGLRALLQGEKDFKLEAETDNGPDTVRLVEKHHPDVLVLDLMLKGLNGFDVAREVRVRSSRTRIVILSMHSNEAYVVEALRAGASGYVLKEAGAEHLVKAIRAVAEGRRYFSPPFSEESLQAYNLKAEGQPLDPLQTLTFREREVLQLTAEGHSSSEIARQLFISPRTVESHRANLMKKLHVRNLKELIRLAVQRGVLAEPKETP